MWWGISLDGESFVIRTSNTAGSLHYCLNDDIILFVSQEAHPDIMVDGNPDDIEPRCGHYLVICFMFLAHNIQDVMSTVSVCTSTLFTILQ